MFAFAPVAALSILWGVIAFAILRGNERREFERDARFPRAGAIATSALILLAAYLLPAPWNASVALAIAGFGVASWGDVSSRILWDEITIGTVLLVAAAMLFGGKGVESLEGGIACGAMLYIFYFAALLCGRETGFGDVKLAAGIGFALGPVAGLTAIFAGAIVWLVVVLAWARVRKIPYAALRVMPLPFGPGLTAGLLVGACTIPFIGSLA